MTEKPKYPPHRPCKLTPAIQEKIVSLVRAGNYIETAAAAAGISKVTLYAWMKRGNKQNSGIFKDFLNAIQKAVAEAEAIDVNNIAKAAQKGQWQASAWRLERKFPKRWGRYQSDEDDNVGVFVIKSKIAGDILIEQRRLTDEEKNREKQENENEADSGKLHSLEGEYEEEDPSS